MDSGHTTIKTITISGIKKKIDQFKNHKCPTLKSN
jgi:hypothetical protein